MRPTSNGNHIAWKGKWAIALLWINLAVALVLLFEFMENQFSSVRNLLQALAYALVYANLTGLLGTWVSGGLAAKLYLRKIPLIPTVMVGILVLSAVGCLLLNSISSLIPVNPARAEQIVGRLAVLLRLSLDTSGRPLIPLWEELAMVESYLDIEKVRFGDKLRTFVNVPAELQNAVVPPMSVQSLVENAVKYGVTSQSDGGECLIAASVEGESLRIEVRDTGPGFDLAAIPAGHGLDNL